MATSTQQRDRLRALRQKLDGIRVVDDSVRGLFVQAMGNFLTAASYPDVVLMRSALEEAKTALGVDITAGVEELIGRSLSSQALLREVTDVLEGVLEGVPVEPCEELDDMGRAVTDVVSLPLHHLRGFRDGPLAMARKHGLDVPNAAKLDEHITQWETVKANLVDCWPWSNVPAPLPPVDREMVARSRAAILAGEPGEDINALIERLRSE